MKTIALFFGGPGSEYDVSLHSVASILENSSSTYKFILVGITETGIWLQGDYTVEEIQQDGWQGNIAAREIIPSFAKEKCLVYLDNKEELFVDGAFNMIHGSYGEDGTLSALLEVAKIPYVGSGIESSSICFDKELVHRLFKKDFVAMANYQVIRKNQPFLYSEIVANLSLPFVIKPAREGSSYGVHLVQEEDDFLAALEDAFLYDDKILVEEYVRGKELGCAVMQKNQEIIVGEIDEISLQKAIFDYEAKYEMIDAEIICPARIEKEISDKVQRQAAYVFEQLECKDFARIDFFLTDDKRLLLNEVNTIPGFTSHSRFPNMFEKSGVPFSELINQLLENVTNGKTK